MNLTLPATASSVELGLSLVADAIRADLKLLGYKPTALIVTTQTQIHAEGMRNYSGIPWTASAFFFVGGVERMYQGTGDKIESCFADLIKKLPAATEANA